MSLSTLVIALSETVAEHSAEPAVSPYTVGAVALGILIVMLLILLAFGGGREHS
ncbi:hypothetical protein [Nocardioides cavernaquae]|uniref:hypothetical protein n=1 Tax=Nocardioides cavernaquae TaxID=2321396 RepID=UPI001600118F|nr:hypothetical protein [Nocardioides cavernaquae]